MKQRRALRWGCHAAVLIWCSAALSQVVWPPREEPRPSAARVRPVPTPAPQAAPAPPEPEAASEPPPPEPASPEPAPVPPEPRPRAVGRAELAAGGALLDAGGDFPVLSFSYEDFPSFREYARAMQRLGACLVVVRSREIVGGVDLESGAIEAVAVGPGFSPRARDYTGEPDLAPLARIARERFGREAVVMMLVPRALDAGLFGGLDRVLAERGERRERVREIRGRYLRGPGGGVRLRVEAALRRDGTALSVEALFDLRQITRGTRA
jgi:hypothetical protein